MWPVLAAMTGVGLLRGHQQQKRQEAIEDQTRKMRAAEIRYSPWTGMGPSTQIRHAADPFSSVLGSGLQGFGSGLMLNQAYNQLQGPPEQPTLMEQQQNPRYGNVAMANPFA